MIKITRDLILGICRLIIGKNKNFSEEDIDLIFKRCALIEKDKKELSPITVAVANHVISWQNNRKTLELVTKNLKAKEVSNEDKICILACMANNSEKVDLIEGIQVILETGFYSGYSPNFSPNPGDKLFFEFIEN